MSIPSRGSRPIEIDGVAYRWRIRRRPTYAQACEMAPMIVAVQRASEDARAVLIVDLSVTRPDNWLAPHTTGITPAQVRGFVREALAAGWDPIAGGTFRITVPVIRDTIGGPS